MMVSSYRMFSRSVVVGLAMVISSTALGYEDRLGVLLQRERPVPTNAAGQPVRAADRSPINYSSRDLLTLDEAASTSVAPAVAAAGTSARSSVRAGWGYGTLGSGIGLSGIVTAQNGTKTEIYVGGSTITFGADNTWYALQYSETTHDYQQIYVSEFFPQGIARITLAHFQGQPSYKYKIVVGLKDGNVALYEPGSKRLLSNRAGPCKSHGGLQTLATADLDGNGSDEFISSCQDKTLFVHGISYMGWMLTGVGAAEVVVGQMDDDPALEIATAGGWVIDSSSHAAQWQVAGGLGAHLQTADIDADGRDELVSAAAWYSVTAYDVESQQLKWTIPTNQDIGAIRVVDIDGDGTQELLIGDGQWGRLRAYDTVTLQQEWTIQNPEHGVTNIAVSDVNNDRENELLWGAGATSTGSDHLYVADWQTGMIQWQNEHLDGPFVGPQVADLDADGIPEIVGASYTSESGYDSGRIVVIDSQTLTVRAISAGVAGGVYGWTGVHDLKLRDLDEDGRPEIIVATDWLYDGLIEAYSFSASNTFSLVWSNASQPSGAPFYSVDVADVDGDAQLEVIGGGGREHTGALGTFIYAYDPATGAERWHTLQLGDYWSTIKDLVIADTDGDNQLEFIGMVDGGDVFVFDGVTLVLEATIDTQGSSLTTIPLASGTGLFLGDTLGHVSVRAFDGSGYPEVNGADLAPTAIDGLNYAASGALWMGSGGTLVRYQNNAVTLRTANYGARFGRRIGQAPGRIPWLFSAGGYGVHGFRLPRYSHHIDFSPALSRSSSPHRRIARAWMRNTTLYKPLSLD